MYHLNVIIGDKCTCQWRSDYFCGILLLITDNGELDGKETCFKTEPRSKIRIQKHAVLINPFTLGVH